MSQNTAASSAEAAVKEQGDGEPGELQHETEETQKFVWRNGTEREVLKELPSAEPAAALPVWVCHNKRPEEANARPFRNKVQLQIFINKPLKVSV